MAFDISSAQPVDAGGGGGFDLSSAQPVANRPSKEEIQSIFANGPLKLGKEALADALRQTLQEAGWINRNIAGAGSAVVNAYEGVKGLFGKTDADQVANQKIIADSAPVGNIAGNVALLAPTALIPGANTVAGAATVGAIQGALLTPGDIKERAKAAAIGGAGGAVGAKLSNAMQGVAPSSVNPSVRTLGSEGVGLTPGQNAGGAIKAMEDKATSVPFLGDVINSARKRGIDDFNKAAIARAEVPGVVSTGGQVGNAAVQDLRQGLGQAYDDVLAKSSANALEPEFVQKIASLRSMVSALPAKERQAFDKIIDREIGDRMAPNGMLNAENLQGAKSGLGEQAMNFSSATDGYQRQLGQALKQAGAEFRDLVSRANPQNAKDLQAIDSAYANFKRIQKAAGGVGAEGGVFTPAQLHSAVKSADRTKDKRAFSEGDALLQDLSAAGKEVMPSKIPDSGTAGRMMGNLFSLGGLASSAGGLAAALPAYLAYSRPGSAAINGAVNKLGIPAKNALMKALAENPNASRNLSTALAKLVSN